MAKNTNRSFFKDVYSFGPYILNCFEALTRRLLKKDVLFVSIFLILILWFRYVLSKNFKVIELSFDGAFYVYDGVAKLINILDDMFKDVFHEIEKLEKDIHIDDGKIKKYDDVLNDVTSVNLYIFKISGVNQVLSGLGNNRDFVTASELKIIFAEFAGNEMCFFSRACVPTILSFVGYILKFFAFHGGYKPDPSNIYENCMVQQTTPGQLTTWLNVLFFFVQIITSLLLGYLIIVGIYVLRYPKKYIS